MIDNDSIRRRVRVKITHIPTGISASASCGRFHHENKTIAIKLLASKIKAICDKSDALIACYDIKDGNYYPDNLSDYKVECD